MSTQIQSKSSPTLDECQGSSKKPDPLTAPSEKEAAFASVESQSDDIPDGIVEQHLRDYGSTWDGPNDPENPYNWPTSRKITIGVVFSCGQLITLMSASMIAASLQDISRDLHTSATTCQIILSTYFLGLGLGPFVAGATAELYGRRPVWIFGSVWYCLWNALCPIGNNTGFMIFGRLMTGIGASVGVTLTGPVMADLYRAKDRGKSLAIATLLPYLGPALGPIVGGVATQYVSWHWVFYIMSMFNAAVTAVGILAIRESYTPVLLRKKASKHPNAAPISRISFFNPRTWPRVFTNLSKHLARPLRLFSRPIIQLIALALALDFGVYTIMLSTFAALFENKYHETQLISSLHYISIAIGSTICGQAGGYLMDATYKALSKREDGKGRPEFRVPYILAGLIVMPAGLFWYGWSAEHGIAWIMVDIGAALFTLGSFVSSQGLLAYQLDEFAEFGASANAASRLLYNIFGFAFPIFAPRLYDALGYGWSNSLLAFIIMGVGLPVPIILWIWGAKLRNIGKKRD